ncbi:hypothetical protein AVEN_168200-1 [Araneus ventricosus]|uniref:Uncharacterized protein n=1 Tax=Araneus ventricosus TaxID=182803 RepID=A0A4Y2KML4_ARAVE|nr:hypothetical protein AVEN_168200-1 [Araneus ventricosus]
MKQVEREVMEIIRLSSLDIKVPSDECSSDEGPADDLKNKTQEWEHKNFRKNDDGFYVCLTCHEELRYNPNKPPFDLLEMYLNMKRQQRWKSRMKKLTKWLGTYNIPFEEELLDELFDLIHRYEELFLERKSLISKEYILFHLLRKRDYQAALKLPKMKKTLDQSEEICRTFNALK